jgi:maltose phosphorylase
MTKFADRYIETLEWGIAEKGFHPEKGRVSESLFSLANERMGVRGYFEEGYSGDRLVGSYLGGVYEELRVQKSYKGVSDRVCFMVNTLDWLRVGLVLDGERLDLATSAHSGFVRELDFRTGLLSRSFTWKTREAPGKPAKELELRFERFLSMDDTELGYQRISITPRNFSGKVTFEAGLDFSPPHEVYGRNYWNCEARGARADGAWISAASVSMGQRVRAAFALRLDGRGGAAEAAPRHSETERYAGVSFALRLEQGLERVVEKTSAIASGEAARDGSRVEALLASAAPFDAALEANRRYWKAVWDRADIAIEGDPENQQGIRFCVFQLEQTYRGLLPLSNIGAKGLSGEFYNGNYFWDTEAYCFPYYLFNDRRAARALLEYRYRTLPQAMERARDLDCRGACYPVATIDGTESCTLWQHASLQLQPTTAVAYAIRHYALASGDSGFLFGEGLEMLIQIARFLASRAQWSERKQAYGYFCVMGPDEFQMMVNHNAYTNYMGARSLAYAAEVLERARAEAPELARAAAARAGLESGEAEEWRRMASLMYIPRGESPGEGTASTRESLLYEQHEGYFDLPHVDKDSIPPEEFPLYSHWSYDRIYRNDMIKQPDVLMFMFLYNGSFSLEEKRANYEFYEPRCIHESSLSPSVHSILASELGKGAEAYGFFKFATRIDLDDYNRNTREGLHMTAIAAAWMNIVYGFAGFRSDKGVPSLAPSLPAAWRGYSLRMRVGGGLVSLRVSGDGVSLALLDGEGPELELYGERVTIGREALVRPLRAAGEGKA